MKKIYIISVLILSLLSFAGCGGESDTPKEDVNTVRQEYLSGSRKVDYEDAASFENALNNGEKVQGKIVRFDVQEYKPDSSLGVNCYSGEHLNFISDNEFDVLPGDIIVAYVKEEPSTILGSWKIPYEILEIKLPEGVIEEDSDTVENVVDASVIENVEKETDESLEEPDEESAENEIEESETIVAYATDRVKVRQQPNTDCDVLGMMDVGDEVTVLGIEGDWSHVLAGGNDGYIKSEFLSENAPSSENAQASISASESSASVTPAVEAAAVAAATAVVGVTTTPAVDTSSSGGDSNFNTYDNAEQQQTSAQFVLNVKSKKVHYPSCSSVPKISPENYAVSNEPFSVLEQKGYTSCGNCHAH